MSVPVRSPDEISQGSSDSGLSTDSAAFRKAEKIENEKKAVEELERAKTKAVAFAVRTNISYDSTMSTDVPLEGHAVTFGVRDFLHIKQRFNDDWWIGRLVKIGADLGFIPSPTKIEAMRSSKDAAVASNAATGGPNAAGNMVNGNSGMPAPPGATGVSRTGSQPPGIQVFSANRQSMPEPGDPDPNGPAIMEEIAPDDLEPGPNDGQQTPGVKGAKGGPVNAANKKKPFFKKSETVPPYEVVPCMRPVIFCGPALKGYEVTDMMQKALFDCLKKNLEGRIIITRVSADISMAKRSAVGMFIDQGKKAGMDRTARNRNTSMLEVQQEVERIFELASTMQLVVLDCDTINHPSQVIKTCLAPLIVYIKISSVKVLTKLIRNRGKSQKKNLSVQAAAAEKLLTCPHETFDLILDKNTLIDASLKLTEFLEAYWHATHPPNMQSKAERILGVGGGPGAPQGPRRRPPVDPATASMMRQLGAGFTGFDIDGLGQPGTSGCINDEDDIFWGGDPEEYRSDRELRVDNADRAMAPGQAVPPGNITVPGSMAVPGKTLSNVPMLKSRSARQQKQQQEELQQAEHEQHRAAKERRRERRLQRNLTDEENGSAPVPMQ